MYASNRTKPAHCFSNDLTRMLVALVRYESEMGRDVLRVRKFFIGPMPNEVYAYTDH